MNATRAAHESPLLRLSGINLQRGGKILLQDVDLSVCAGEIVTLIGPNGAGKSMLVKIALNLLQPDRGTVERRHRLSIGYVPQKIEFDQTLPLTVRRFLKLQSRHPQDSTEHALTQALDQAGVSDLGDLGGLGELRDAPLQSLSGGEMRRVLLARALLREPDLLIMDEPAAGMDIHGQTELYRLVQNIRERRQCGILLVSHDLFMVMASTDRVFCLNRHLCCSGQPEDVRQHPQFLALFGDRVAQELAVYHHRHDHEHDLHGDIETPPATEHEAQPRG